MVCSPTFVTALLLVGVATDWAGAKRQDFLAEPPVCPPEGTVNFPDPDSCSGYYVCTLGELIHFECPAGTYWNQEEGQCDLPENVDCTIGLATTEVTTTGPVEPDCPVLDGIYQLPYPGNCSLYFICYNNGESFKLESCAEGLFFDPILAACNVANEVDCNDGSTTSPTTTIEPSTLKPTPPPGDFNCPSGVEFIYMPHPELCTLFYWCRNGEYDGMSNCGQGLWFSFVLQACVPPFESDCEKEPLPITTPAATS